MTTVDVAVIGAGMIGAAAGRYLAEFGHNVTIFGQADSEELQGAQDLATPDRPAAGPFASHNDAGRITRIVDVKPLWAQLAADSIAQYEDLSRRSGITFHHRRGLAWILDSERLTEAVDDGLRRGADVRMITPEWLRQVTGIASPSVPGLSHAYEGPPAGHVNPRLLVAAELAVAMQAGATVVPSAVERLEREPTGPSAGTVSLTGSFGAVNARRVLLATGMYGAQLAGVDLAMTRWPRTTVRAEIDSTAPLPSLIAYEVEQPDIDRIYWVPPVAYPDGRIMLKIGGTYSPSTPLENVADIAGWYGSGGSIPEATALRQVISELLPDSTIRSWEAVPCVVTKTATDYPYLGWLDDQVAVAVGGNGSAAKSGDAIGRIAASLFDEEGRSSDLDIDLSPFELVHQSS